MEMRSGLLLLILSLAALVLDVRTTDPRVLAARRRYSSQEALMESGIGIDDEAEEHFNTLKEHENLPGLLNTVLESMMNEIGECKASDKYRKADGLCNNLKDPLTGASLHVQERLLPNAYMDGVGVPRMTGKETSPKQAHYLPSARTVSLDCFKPNYETDEYLDQHTSQMSMQFGQYLDHDVTFTEVMKGSGCCSDPKHTCIHPDTFSGGPCYPIQIEDGDRYFNQTCMPFKRSFSIERDGVQEQISGITAFVDASTVYGSNQALQNKLRKLEDGLLKTEEEFQKNTLPLQGPYKCKKELVNIAHCPHAGDVRVNVFPGLMLLHLLFMREHNRLAQRLKEVNPLWDDEKLFQEARKINIAFHQMITYEEYLPHILGPQAMEFFRLGPNDYVYDEKVHANILNEFSTAAFRFGHSQINGLLNGRRISEVYFQPWKGTRTETELKDTLKSQVKNKAQKANKLFTKEVSDLLFLNMADKGASTDLPARNVQRGRDHGLRPYLDYLDLVVMKFLFLGNSSYQTSNLPDCYFKGTYDFSQDIDLFVGAMHETHMTGGLVGPTNAYIIGEQFRRLKFGDRFWFETTDPVTGFTIDQLAAIRTQSFAHIICRCTKVGKIARDVFSVDAYTDGSAVHCSSFEDIDLTAWKELAD